MFIGGEPWQSLLAALRFENYLNLILGKFICLKKEFLPQCKAVQSFLLLIFGLAPKSNSMSAISVLHSQKADIK